MPNTKTPNNPPTHGTGRKGILRNSYHEAGSHQEYIQQQLESFTGGLEVKELPILYLCSGGHSALS